MDDGDRFNFEEDAQRYEALRAGELGEETQDLAAFPADDLDHTARRLFDTHLPLDPDASEDEREEQALPDHQPSETPVTMVSGWQEIKFSENFKKTYPAVAGKFGSGVIVPDALMAEWTQESEQHADRGLSTFTGHLDTLLASYLQNNVSVRTL